MTKKSVAISKVAVIVLAAFCLPLAACSKAARHGEVVAAAGKGKGHVTSGWMNGGGNKGAGLIGGGGFAGQKGGFGGGGGKRTAVKIPRIGGKTGKGN